MPGCGIYMYSQIIFYGRRPCVCAYTFLCLCSVVCAPVSLSPVWVCVLHSYLCSAFVYVPCQCSIYFFFCLIWISMRRLFLNAVSCLFPIRQPNNIFLFVQACALFCSFVPRVSFSPYSVILCYFKPVVLLIVEYHVSFRVCSPYCRIPCVFTFLFSLQ